jgi:L-alanine-DL-glutamate epimerase-like enolase superfamily enzyme
MAEADLNSEPRLARVEAIHVRVPFRRPLLDATGEFTHRRSWLLRVIGEDGAEGLGEAALNPFAEEVTTASLATLIREIVPALAAERMPVWSELAAEGEPGRAAMAGVDGAIAALRAARADRAARAVGRSGAATGRPSGTAALVPVVAIIGFTGPGAGADAAAQAVELGFGTLKLRAGFERTTDQLVDRIRAIRGAVGPEPRIRIDAGGAWDLDTAAERMVALEPFRIEFVEQPLPAWDTTRHAALRERTVIPIALDESIDSEASALAALADGAAQVIVVKPARVGGLAATLRIAEAARAARASVVLGTYYETGVGMAAVLRIAAELRAVALRAAPSTKPELAHAVATAGVLRHDLLAMPIPIEKGRMTVPGVIELDEVEVDRYALERFEALP